MATQKTSRGARPAQHALLLRLATLLVLSSWAPTPAEGLMGMSTKTNLYWAPHTIQKPYITYLNDFVFPSWKTKHHMTMERLSRTHLTLPRGVPFAAVCGACYSRSKHQGEIRVDGDPEFSSTQLPTNNPADVFHYMTDISCRQAYIQTQPLYASGGLSCSLLWNKSPYTETVTFNVKKVHIKTTKEELTTRDPTVDLQCPDIKSLLARDNPLVFVWHRSDALSESDFQSMTYPTRANLTLEIHKDETTITCSAYNIYNPTVVLQKTYVIRRLGGGTDRYTSDNKVNVGFKAASAGGRGGSGGTAKGASHGLSLLLLIAIVVGSLFGFALLVATTTYCFRRCDTRSESRTPINSI
ncbi:uncharacterized protein LOC143040385 [Oratosquilla oratoria]|uniref:uncharacterized protein LOC143040385 n=1 Tax=Oratosquilla oratoria TaxID=337810 RepID=UPI003F76F182